MNEDKIVGYIYETTDYAKFKKWRETAGLKIDPRKLKKA